jgi:hypothetical protein
MNYKILGSVAVALLAGPISANAQPTTYTYQGDAFTAGTYDLNPPAGFTGVLVPPNFGVGPLNGFITLSAPLGDNLNNVTVTPTFVDISSDINTLFKGVFVFSTNGQGAIDRWSMSLDGSYNGFSGLTLTATSSDIGGVGGDSVAMSETCTAFFPLQPPQRFACGDTGSNMKPGVWTSPTRAPEIDPASAASGLTLLLGGVAVLCGRRKLES